MQAFFKIRFILRDLYVQLEELHQQQIGTLLQNDLHVYRGANMSVDELNRLKIIGELFITRNCLSTTTNPHVSLMYTGNNPQNQGDIAVLLEMIIEKVQIQDKIVAFIDHMSASPHEEEVMLSMGIDLRIDCVEETNDESGRLIRRVSIQKQSVQRSIHFPLSLTDFLLYQGHEQRRRGG